MAQLQVERQVQQEESQNEDQFGPLLIGRLEESIWYTGGLHGTDMHMIVSFIVKALVLQM